MKILFNQRRKKRIKKDIIHVWMFKDCLKGCFEECTKTRKEQMMREDKINKKEAEKQKKVLETI